MEKELHELLATAAADYRARGDLATAERFDSILTSQAPEQGEDTQMLRGEAHEQPEIRGYLRRWAYDKVVPAKVRNENNRLAWPKKFLLLSITQNQCLRDDEPVVALSQHERMLGALRKENEALRICYGDQQDKRLAAEHELNELKIEHGSIQARVAELEADLLRSAEGTDIIGGLISSIEKHGNYSAESTVVYLRQALGCFNRFSPVSDVPVKGEVSRDE
ncbi:hypothetical protein KIP75_30140 [Pseudomonas aeruginosa]|uniref:hypothetical protein n=1 Tax=Pseudomonas aeruginosa TaxID=287 RepID=UPI001BFF7E1E|nr:hypothetical protein [Pseudomonas aeruginosa]MBT9123842.1 hypothetical protein [Pseudomonas aeruginosa]